MRSGSGVLHSRSRMQHSGHEPVLCLIPEHFARVPSAALGARSWEPGAGSWEDDAVAGGWAGAGRWELGAGRTTGSL